MKILASKQFIYSFLIIGTLLCVAYPSPSPAETGHELYDAVGQYDLARVKLLLEAGADVNEPYIREGVEDGKRWSNTMYPIIEAAKRTIECEEDVSRQILRVLLSAGADVNSVHRSSEQTYTSLYYPVGWPCPPVVKLLLAAGADPTMRVDSLNHGNGMTVLEIAETLFERYSVQMWAPSGVTSEQINPEGAAMMKEILSLLRQWEQPATAQTSPPATAVVTGDPADGDLYGSIAFSQTDGGGYAWGIAWDYGDRARARQGAIDECRTENGPNCAESVWFRNACGALAIGDDNGYGAGWGESIAQAEQMALSVCLGLNENCRNEVARCAAR